MIRIALVGGGTGGHFYPLMAIAEALRERPAVVDLYYIGPTPYDEEALASLGIFWKRTPAGKTRRYFSFLNFLDGFKTFFGVFIAIGQLFKLYPDVVVSKGGYTSVPVVIAAWLLRIPIVIHESDAKPGRANTFASNFARYIAISYPEVAEYFPASKTALIGIPIRKAFLAPVAGNPHAPLGTSGQKPLVIVLGGSSGAERINTLILDALPELLEKYEVFHQTGAANEVAVKETAAAILENNPNKGFYHAVGFVKADVMHAALSAASIAIARSGSTTITELSLKGVPAILIPIPEEISHDQRSNAYAYARTGAALVMEEKNITQHLLVAEIDRIIGTPGAADAMKAAASGFAQPDAAGKIADLLIAIGQEHGG